MKLRLFSVVAALGAIFCVAEGSAQELPYRIFERYLNPWPSKSACPGFRP